MANVIKKSTNKWTKGLVLDFSPENTSNEVLTHALNATLVTFNGNELSLQNDMGNARVETAYLPEGYIPVGTCEYGGIIYIVSYNPLENKSLIGCFPSPERNVSSDELGELTDSITNGEFINSDYSIKNASKLIILKRDPLNPGDKYIITSNSEIYGENLHNLYTDNGNGFELLDNPFIALNIVSIEDSGKITYLDCDVAMYENGKYKYHILGSNFDSGTSKDDIDAYRTITSSGYNVFKSKISGKLAILAELIMVDSYSVTHKIEATSNPNEYDIILDIETSSEDTYQKYNIVPLLSYYYLEQSQGYIPFYGKPEAGEELDVVGDPLRKMFDVNGDTTVFDNTLLSDIGYKKFTTEKLSDVIKTHNFPKPSTYHEEKKMFCKAGYFYRFIKNHVMDSDGNLYEDFADETFYQYIKTKKEFQPITLDGIKFQQGDQIIFINPTSDLTISYIETYRADCGIPMLIVASNGMEGSVSTINSLNLTNILKDNIRLYNKLHFANIELDLDSVNSIPFKYEYKIVPCMAYGKLNHLAVSNSINFEHINDFNQSKFNTWKYRVDGDLLRLTVGAEVYDTNAADGNVVGIVLEFYDYRGFAGSLIFQNRNSYSGEFTKLITLNALGALSTQKLEMNDNDGHFVTDYQRHISIQTNGDDTGMLDGKKVEWKADKGWRYESGGDLELNDCGTLYPNLVYGVIPYFLQKGSNDDYIVSKRDLMFLFTSTLLNEHYYTCRNFNLLHDHKLDIVLTYKIDDQSSIEPYKNTLLPDSDPNAFNQYLSGNYSELELHSKKYLLYVGKSKLQLEIGLKEDYKNIGLYNSPEINDLFTCTLLLINDKGEVGYDVKSDDSNLQTAAEIIGYNPEVYLYKKYNYIHFPGHTPINPITEYEITKNFALYNFISNPSNTLAIELSYCFTVGHQVDITDIKDTRIPTTTVCALCHKRDDGTYNYDDFGIYEVAAGDLIYYLSNTIVYNAGDSETERLGIYKLIGVQGQLSAQCESLYLTECKAVLRTRAGNLGSGNNLRSLVNSIGKLSFCLPHAHGSLDSEEGWPNIYNQGLTVNDPYAVATTLNLGRDIDPNFNYEKNDIANGIYPVRSYYYAPRYNSCLLTQSCVDHLNEFISTMDSNVLSIGKTILFDGKGGNDAYADPIETDSEIATLTQCSKFIGFNGNQLATYNKKLLLTMKMVYAYNPDYDYLTIKAGNVNIKDTQCKFTSHLLSKSAVLDIPSLTNYLYFGQYPVSNYLKEMDYYSDIEVLDTNHDWVPQVNFKADLTYCGESSPVLLTTLTYNIPIPELLYNDLRYENNDDVVIRNHDGSIKRVRGLLNKLALYGYNNDKLMSLDVSNYEIDLNGCIILHNPKKLLNSDYILKCLFKDYVYESKENELYKIDTNIPYTIIDDKIYLLVDCSNSDLQDTSTFPYIHFNEIVSGENNYVQEVQMTVKCNTVPKDTTVEKLNSNTIQSYFTLSGDRYSVIFRSISGTPKFSTSTSASSYTKIYEDLGEIWISVEEWDEGGFLGLLTDSLTLIELSHIYLNHSTTLVDPVVFTSTDSIINVVKTSEYCSMERDFVEGDFLQYNVDTRYKNTVFKGTSITLNDLQYIPNPTGHRLYMKPNLVKYDTSVNNKIYYRYENENPGTGSKFGGVKTADCTYNTTKDLNCLYLFTGPCFTPDTL